MRGLSKFLPLQFWLKQKRFHLGLCAGCIYVWNVRYVFYPAGEVSGRPLLSLTMPALQHHSPETQVNQMPIEATNFTHCSQPNLRTIALAKSALNVFSMHVNQLRLVSQCLGCMPTHKIWISAKKTVTKQMLVWDGGTHQMWNVSIRENRSCM